MDGYYDGIPEKIKMMSLEELEEAIIKEKQRCDMLNNLKEGQYVKIYTVGICGYVVDIRKYNNECTIERDMRNAQGDFELIDCSIFDIDLAEDKNDFLSRFPKSDLTIEEAKRLFKKCRNEQDLSNIYSEVDNMAKRLKNYLYDIECENVDISDELMKASSEWSALEDKIQKEIFKILRKEKVMIPRVGFSMVLIPFMERNGYRDGQGWWIKKSDD